MDFNTRYDIANEFGYWLRDAITDNVLDNTTESFEDMLYRYINSLETDGVEVENIKKYLYDLFKIHS